jgi:serine/threonine protein kinase
MVVLQMKQALDFTHAAGYAHCDVKPDNIFIDANGGFFLGDFGSMTRLGVESAERTLRWVFYLLN